MSSYWLLVQVQGLVLVLALVWLLLLLSSSEWNKTRRLFKYIIEILFFCDISSKNELRTEGLVVVVVAAVVVVVYRKREAMNFISIIVLAMAHTEKRKNISLSLIRSKRFIRQNSICLLL